MSPRPAGIWRWTALPGGGSQHVRASCGHKDKPRARIGGPVHLAALTEERSNYSLRRFKETAEAMGHKWSRIDPGACDLALGKDRNSIRIGGRKIALPDVAITRRGAAIEDLEITMINQLEHLGVPVINGTYSMLVSRDKYWSLRRLADNGIPVPNTVILHDPKSIEQAYEVVGNPPVVLKILRGMQGTGVMIADSKQSVRSILDTFHNKKERILIQQYIAESAGADVRVLVVGGKIVASMRRQAPVGEFRSNIHRGGSGAAFTLDSKAKDISRKAAKICGLDIAGVDLLYSNEGPMVMEINSAPGFDGLEKATGLDIARIILDHAVAVANGEAKSMALRAKSPKL